MDAIRKAAAVMGRKGGGVTAERMTPAQKRARALAGQQAGLKVRLENKRKREEDNAAI